MSMQRLYWFWLVGVSILLGSSAAAQTGAGTLRGQVTDDSGAVIPAAQVTITNSTGVVRSVATGADGTFVAAGLKPGQYTVRVPFQGFAPKENKVVYVTGGRTRPLKIKLKFADGK